MRGMMNGSMTKSNSKMDAVRERETKHIHPTHGRRLDLMYDLRVYVDKNESEPQNISSHTSEYVLSTGFPTWFRPSLQALFIPGNRWLHNPCVPHPSAHTAIFGVCSLEIYGWLIQWIQETSLKCSRLLSASLMDIKSGIWTQ